MTRRHDQITHRRKLSEIRNIMNSMKTLAIMETHKLERFIETQTAMITSIENIAADFLHFNSQVLPVVEPTSNIILLIGSERGFCGDFNEELVKKLEQSFPHMNNTDTVISVGNKLHPLLNKKYNNICIEGASVVEDISNVVDSLSAIFTTQKKLSSLYVMHHDSNNNTLKIDKLMPPFKELDYEKKVHLNPPSINLTSRDFFLELTEHYLFNLLNGILYSSLMVENHRRVQHLENATHHLDNKTDELKHKINALRQEEIIEEIEVILLNSSNI